MSSSIVVTVTDVGVLCQEITLSLHSAGPLQTVVDLLDHGARFETVSSGSEPTFTGRHIFLQKIHSPSMITLFLPCSLTDVSVDVSPQFSHVADESLLLLSASHANGMREKVIMNCRMLGNANTTSGLRVGTTNEFVRRD